MLQTAISLRAALIWQLPVSVAFECYILMLFCIFYLAEKVPNSIATHCFLSCIPLMMRCSVMTDHFASLLLASQPANNVFRNTINAQLILTAQHSSTQIVEQSKCTAIVIELQY
jgi:hypothetical protein